MLRRGLLLAFVLLGVATQVRAQPVNHGQLRILHRGRGHIDLQTGSASFRFRGWSWLPSPTSNGMFPGTELVTVGIADEKFLIPAGMMHASKSGKRFTYRARTDRGVQSLTLVHKSDGSYTVSLAIAGVDLSVAIIQDPPVCIAFAVIVGDDDGFTGVLFDRPKPFPSPLLTLPGFCQDVPTWPWA